MGKAKGRASGNVGREEETSARPTARWYENATPPEDPAHRPFGTCWAKKRAGDRASQGKRKENPALAAQQPDSYPQSLSR